MIDVRELRIGNLLYLKGNIVSVGGIPNHMCLLIPNEQYAVDIEEFNSIPLTEELLLKCRFVKRKWGDAIVYYHSLLELDTRFCLNGVDYNIKVKSLHQLQNLYFDLVGEELEIDLLNSKAKKRNANSLKDLLTQTDNPLREKAREMMYSDTLKYLESVVVKEDISDFIDTDKDDYDALLPEK